MGTKELEKKSSGGGLVAAWKQNPLVSTGLVLILMIVVQTAIMIYNFGEGSVGELMLSLLTNWLNILRNNAPVGIIALGMTFVIISGGIDLSVGSTLVAVGAMVMMVVDGSATGLLAGMGITGVPAYIIAIAVGLVFGRCWAGSTACSSPTASCPPSSPPWAPCRSSAPSPST